VRQRRVRRVVATRARAGRRDGATAPARDSRAARDARRVIASGRARRVAPIAARDRPRARRTTRRDARARPNDRPTAARTANDRVR